jgi:hypothetical protein
VLQLLSQCYVPYSAPFGLKLMLLAVHGAKCVMLHQLELLRPQGTSHAFVVGPDDANIPLSM